jgi:hypothetical protein
MAAWERDQASRFAGERPFGDAWWWQRLPRTGPAREEIDEVTAS